MNGGRGELSDRARRHRRGAQSRLRAVKLNTVVERGKNDHTLLDLVERFRGTGIIVRFIEFMDVGTVNGWQPRAGRAVEGAARANCAHGGPCRRVDSNYRGEVAKRYAFDDGQGEIGFISSVSEPFCGDCHRARLSADGTVYTCLFASQRHRPARPVALGRERRRSRRSAAKRLAQPRRTATARSVAGCSSTNPTARKRSERVEMYRMGG